MFYNFTDSLIEEYTNWLNEDIESARAKYPHISEEDFNKIIRLDPTFIESKNSLGSFGKWLLDSYKRANPLNFKGDVKELLLKYNNLKQDKTKSIEKNIMNIKSLDDLQKIVDNVQDSEKTVKNKKAEQDYTKEFEDENWVVYVPHTYQASMLLGKDTRWCTAGNHGKHKNDPEQAKEYFNKYYNMGQTLYILINKKAPTDKYQFCFDSNEYMDFENEPIEPGLFSEKFIADKKLINFFDEDGQDLAYTLEFVIDNYNSLHADEVQEEIMLQDRLDEVCNRYKILSDYLRIDRETSTDNISDTLNYLESQICNKLFVAQYASLAFKNTLLEIDNLEPNKTIVKNALSSLFSKLNVNNYSKNTLDKLNIKLTIWINDNEYFLIQWHDLTTDRRRPILHQHLSALNSSKYTKAIGMILYFITFFIYCTYRRSENYDTVLADV